MLFLIAIGLLALIGIGIAVKMLMTPSEAQVVDGIKIEKIDPSELSDQELQLERVELDTPAKESTAFPPPKKEKKSILKNFFKKKQKDSSTTKSSINPINKFFGKKQEIPEEPDPEVHLTNLTPIDDDLSDEELVGLNQKQQPPSPTPDINEPLTGTASLTTIANEENSTPPEQQPEPLSQAELTSIEKEVDLSTELSELKEKYEKLDKLFQEKSAQLENTQTSLDNEIKNRKEFNKIKDLLEKEIKDEKDKNKDTQAKLNSTNAETESLQKRIIQLEEKTTKLEKDLLAKEDENVQLKKDLMAINEKQSAKPEPAAEQTPGADIYTELETPSEDTKEELDEDKAVSESSTPKQSVQEEPVQTPEPEPEAEKPAESSDPQPQPEPEPPKSEPENTTQQEDSSASNPLKEPSQTEQPTPETPTSGSEDKAPNDEKDPGFLSLKPDIISDNSESGVASQDPAVPNSKPAEGENAQPEAAAEDTSDVESKPKES